MIQLLVILLVINFYGYINIHKHLAKPLSESSLSFSKIRQLLPLFFVAIMYQLTQTYQRFRYHLKKTILWIFGQENQNCVFKMKFDLWTNLNILNSMVIITFSVVDRKLVNETVKYFSFNFLKTCSNPLMYNAVDLLK